jgi:hypothetical protein
MAPKKEGSSRGGGIFRDCCDMSRRSRRRPDEGKKTTAMGAAAPCEIKTRRFLRQKGKTRVRTAPSALTATRPWFLRPERIAGAERQNG